MLVVAGGLAFLWWWTGETVPAPPASGSVVAAHTTGGTLTESPPIAAKANITGGDLAESPPADSGGSFWANVERHCPWPPDPSSWQVLDEPCLSLLNERMLDDEWRSVLDEPLAAWHAADAALERDECIVPKGEVRPDLREACAADAIVQVALLQRKCARRVHQNTEELFAVGQQMPDQVDGQEEYHREEQDTRQAAAYHFWEVFTCRTVPAAAHEWIPAIPEPEGDPASLDFEWKPIAAAGGLSRGVLLQPTQAGDLFAAAHRLGATAPD